MQINSVSAQSSFGLKKGMIISNIFDAAKRCAISESAVNPEIINTTNSLINRIQKRAPHCVLNTTGADFYLSKSGKNFYMTDIVPGKGLINSLKKLDIKLAEFDNAAKSGKLANMEKFVPPSAPKHPPIKVRINPDSDLAKRLSDALSIAKTKKN